MKCLTQLCTIVQLLLQLETDLRRIKREGDLLPADCVTGNWQNYRFRGTSALASRAWPYFPNGVHSSSGRNWNDHSYWSVDLRSMPADAHMAHTLSNTALDDQRESSGKQLTQPD